MKARSLSLMNGGGLRSLFVGGHHQAATGQFAVGMFGGGRQEQGHRALHLVVPGPRAPREAVLAHGGDPQAAVALQQLQRVGGFGHARFFGHREDLVLQFPGTHVIECLAGQRRHALLRFGWISASVASNQRGLARGRTALHHHRERPIQQPRGSGQVADQLVRGFTHQAAGLVVLQDPLDQLRVFEQLSASSRSASVMVGISGSCC